MEKYRMINLPLTKYYIYITINVSEEHYMERKMSKKLLN